MLENLPAIKGATIDSIRSLAVSLIYKRPKRLSVNTYPNKSSNLIIGKPHRIAEIVESR